MSGGRPSEHGLQERAVLRARALGTQLQGALEGGGREVLEVRMLVGSKGVILSTRWRSDDASCG